MQFSPLLKDYLKLCASLSFKSSAQLHYESAAVAVVRAYSCTSSVSLGSRNGVYNCNIYLAESKLLVQLTLLRP